MATIKDFKKVIGESSIGSSKKARLLLDCPDGQVSDGYHSFDDLYGHRVNLFIALGVAISKGFPQIDVWRSLVHSDGSNVWHGWFIAGMNCADLQITYHLPIEKWHLCGSFQELDIAPPFDGHTSKDVEDRLLILADYISGFRSLPYRSPQKIS